MAKSVLVTGASGFIGSALTRRLVRDGYAVRALDNNWRGNLRRLEAVKNDIEFVEADIRDTAAVDRALDGMDAVWHLAFVNGTELFYSMPEQVLDVGVRGMLAVLDGCRRHGVGELMLASSSEVYQTPPAVPTDETVPLSVPDVLNPRYSYGGGKIISELMAINYGRKDFDRVMVFRPHNVYGPDMGWEHVLPQFALRLKALVAERDDDPLPFPIQGTGAETRAFNYIDDFVEGIMTIESRGRHLTVYHVGTTEEVAIADRPDGTVPFPIQGTGQETRSFCFVDDLVEGVMAMRTGGAHLGIYHVGTTEEVTIADLAARIAAWAGRTIAVVPGHAPEGATQRRCPDISKLAGLGYKPQVPLADGLPPTLRWYFDNAHLVSRS